MEDGMTIPNSQVNQISTDTPAEGEECVSDMIFRTDVFIVLLPNLKVNFYLEEDV
jgi:hypothetical protein